MYCTYEHIDVNIGNFIDDLRLKDFKTEIRKSAEFRLTIPLVISRNDLS